MPASGGNVPNDPFEKSAMFRDGVLVDLEPPREFFNVSRKFSMECRRSQASGWKPEELTCTSRNCLAGKVARGQIGWQTFEAVLTDLVKHCNAPNLLVNDFMAGVGEVGVAAVRVKVSEVARQCGARVFHWGCDERRMFAEVARANIRTHIGEAFLAGELVAPGLEPVKAPPQTMAAGITKAGIDKFLPTPMAQLSLAADGRLAIPTEQDLKDNPPVSLTPVLLSYFEKLRAEFSQSTSPGPAAGGRSEPPPLPLPPPPKKPGASILSVGETVGNRTDLPGMLRTSGPTSKIHKEVQQNGEWVFLLVEVEDEEAPYRVLLENRSNTPLKLAAGTFVGRGGPGSLVSSSPPEGRQWLHAWLYTRCSEWKRDVATRGNGFWVFKKPASGGGQGAAAGAEKPCLQTLERVMPDVALEELTFCGWGHGCHREQQTATGLECVGLLRPAFEVQLDGPNKETLTPNANPATGGNPLCLFLKKNLVLKPGQLAVL